MDRLIIFFVEYVVFIIVIIAFIYWLTLPNKLKLRMFVFGVIIALVTFILTRIGSALYYDSRPFVDAGIQPIVPHANNNGFPSDHTALAFSAAASVFYMNKRLGAVLLLLATLVGISRVLGYIHSIVDIIGSIIFVFMAYLLAEYLTPKLLKVLAKSVKKKA